MTEHPRSTRAPGPGALTAVMRAAAPPEAPRALRVGLVHRGRVIEERLFERGEHVTVGPNEHATFVVTDRTLPPGYRLFESTGEGFSLHLTPPMRGRLAGAAGVTELGAPPGAPASDTGRAQSTFPLAPDARGRVQIGDHVLLFQLVSPTPKPARRPLPADLRGTFGEVDWRTSIVAAFSFLFHFGAVGSVYSDWMDPVVDDEVDTAQLLETVRQLPPAPPVEKPDETTASAATAAATATAASAPNRSSSGAARSGGATSGPGGGAAGRADARAHQISSELARMEMHVLMGLNASAGSATQAVLGSGTDLPMGMLDKAAASSIGVGRGGVPGIDLGTGSGPLRPGTMARGPGLGDTTSSGPVTAGSAATVKLPTGNASPAAPTIIGGELPDAPGVVAGMSPGFRRCYNLGLRNEDPTMKGSVRFTVKVGPNGGVMSVSGASSGTITPGVVGCMRNRISSAQFAPPASGGATLVIPVTVIPQP